MSTAPLITIFVRHSADCKYRGDEFEKRCRCRKHFRWTHNGVQQRRKAGTRSWIEAETQKRTLEDQLAGRTPQPTTETQGITLAESLRLFDASKEAQGVVDQVRSQYARDLGRLLKFSESRGLFTPTQALTLDNLIAWRATWSDYLESSYTQNVTQRRVRHFLNFAYQAGWIARVPVLSPIHIDEPETEPLTEAEYKRVLSAARARRGDCEVYTLIELMRWSGLAIRDAALLKRTDLIEKDGTYRIVRKRTKTGTPLYIPLKPEVAKQVIQALNGNPVYVFWDRQKVDSSEYNAASHWGAKVSDVFKSAGITSGGHMISHRLRSTFAVDLLQKGVPLEHVSKLLGHANVATTERHYAKWVKGRQDLLDNVVSATW